MEIINPNPYFQAWKFLKKLNEMYEAKIFVQFWSIPLYRSTTLRCSIMLDTLDALHSTTIEMPKHQNFFHAQAKTPTNLAKF